MTACTLVTVRVSTYADGKWRMKIIDKARSFVTDNNHSTTGTIVEGNRKSMSIFGQTLDRARNLEEIELIKWQTRTTKTSGSRLMSMVVCSAISLPRSSRSVDKRNLIQTRIIGTVWTKNGTDASRNRLIKAVSVEQGKSDWRFNLIRSGEHRGLFTSWHESKSYHSDWWASFLKMTRWWSKTP